MSLHSRVNSKLNSSSYSKLILLQKYSVKCSITTETHGGLFASWHHLDTLQRRHNDHDSVSNHQPRGCLLNGLFRRRSKKTSKLRVTGLCVGISPGPVNSPHKGSVTRKMFPFDDVIMIGNILTAVERTGQCEYIESKHKSATQSTENVDQLLCLMTSHSIMVKSRINALYMYHT